MREAEFGDEQLGDGCDPESHDEEDVGQSDLEVVGQLVGDAANLVDGEADGKDDGCQAEKDDGGEADPLGELEDGHVPVAQGHQHHFRRQPEDAAEDAEEGEVPSVAQVRLVTRLRPIEQRHARLRQTDASLASDVSDDPVRVGERDQGKQLRRCEQ